MTRDYSAEINALAEAGQDGDLFAETKARLAMRLLSALREVLEADNRHALASIASALVHERPLTRTLDKLFDAPQPAGPSEGRHPEDIMRPHSGGKGD